MGPCHDSQVIMTHTMIVMTTIDHSRYQGRHWCMPLVVTKIMMYNRWGKPLLLSECI